MSKRGNFGNVELNTENIKPTNSTSYRKEQALMRDSLFLNPSFNVAMPREDPLNSTINSVGVFADFLDLEKTKKEAGSFSSVPVSNIPSSTFYVTPPSSLPKIVPPGFSQEILEEIGKSAWNAPYNTTITQID